MLERDFITITGVDIRRHKLLYRQEYFRGGSDVNGWGWKCDNEEFAKEYGFDYGEDPCMKYLHPCGVRKAIRILEQDKKIVMNTGAKELLEAGLKAVADMRAEIADSRQEIGIRPMQEPIQRKMQRSLRRPIQINITLGEETIASI